ncbi:MAG: hypothetical protein R3F31_18885 [Verrucomicrobiales bacterium]
MVFDSEGLREGQDFSGYRDYRLTIKGGYGARASRTDPNDPTTVFHVAAPVTWQGDIIGVLTVMRSETAMAPFAEETRDRLTWAAPSRSSNHVAGRPLDVLAGQSHRIPDLLPAVCATACEP